MKRFLIVLALVILLTPCVKADELTAQGMSQDLLFKFLSNTVSVVNGNRDNADTMTLSHADFHANATNGTSAQFDIGSTFSYCIDDVVYSKVASDTIASVSAAVQATGTTCLYLVSLDSSGSVTTTKGTAVTYGSTPVYPAIPASNCPFAGIQVAIATTATSTFTLGTTTVGSVTGQTVTAYNLRSVPSGSSRQDDLSLSGL